MSSQGGTRENCPVCGSKDLNDFLEIPQVPVYCNVLWPDREQALAAPKGDLALAFCPGCGHVFNRRFDADLVEYTGDYENSLHFSPRFQQYAEGLAADLIERHGLRDRDIVEIACGKGDFLKLLCEKGGNRGHGFDPSYEPEREEMGMSAELAGGGSVEFVRDYFGEAHANLPADFICCRHALEHIPAATEFLQGLRRGVGDRQETVVFFEVPNSLYSLRDLGIWDFIYEHPSFFSAASLACAFRLAGFAVKNTRETFGGQYLCIESLPGPGPAAPGRAVTDPEKDLIEMAAGLVKALPDHYSQIRRKWRGQLDELVGSGRRAAVWGAGSKGVTFLNIMRAGPEIPFLVDINPHKQGKFAPGTGQPVVSPETLQELPPSQVIVMNPLYQQEIAAQLAGMGLDCEVVAVGG